MKKLYFAYGSNMLQARIEQRVGKVDRIGIHSVAGWRLAFNAGSYQNAFANMIMERGGNYVSGVVYALTDSQIRQLDVFEGAPGLYTRMVIDGYGRADIYAYIAINPAYTQQEIQKVMPTQAYVNLMIAGAIENKLGHLAAFLEKDILPTAIVLPPVVISTRRKKRKK